MDTLDNLDKDVKSCLEFLILNQQEWQPAINIHIGGGKTRVAPLTLIGDNHEEV